MNAKTKQSLTLLSILVIEFIGFNDHFKYQLLGSANTYWVTYFITNLVWFKLSAITVIAIFVFYYLGKLRKKKNEPLYIVFLIKGFQVKGSDLSGVFNVIFTLCSISWIGIELYFQTINGVLNALIFTGFMILYPLICVFHFISIPEEKENYQPKILITALSIVNEIKLGLCLEEMKTKELKDKWLEETFYNPDGSVKMDGFAPWGPWANLDPIRKSIIVHKASFKEIILISTKKASEVCEKLPPDLQPQKIIADFLDIYYPKHRIVTKIKPLDVSGNVLNENMVEIDNILHTLISHKYENRDILFNVTGATVAISGAMILKAITGDRQAEYARQDNGVIENIPIDIGSVKDLWDELLEKVG